MKKKFKKNILITGITGFIGSHLEKKLEEMGATVYGISTSVKKKNIEKINILDLAAVDKFAKSKKISIYIHLAAESLVESGSDNPHQTFKVNSLGTLNILEVSRLNKSERIIIASSSHVYGKNKAPYYEESSLKPSRPYETSKACADLIAQSYADSFKLPVIIPRFVNIYGPGDLNFNRIIPRTIKSIIENKPSEMWGGDVLRDYLFIEDAVKAYLLLLQVDVNKIDKNRIFNFGSGNVATVKELIEKIIEISGTKMQIKKIPPRREFEIRSQFLSDLKAKRLLGWNPKHTLEEGLKKTIPWYKAYLRK